MCAITNLRKGVPDGEMLSRKDEFVRAACCKCEPWFQASGYLCSKELCRRTGLLERINEMGQKAYSVILTGECRIYGRA